VPLLAWVYFDQQGYFRQRSAPTANQVEVHPYKNFTTTMLPVKSVRDANGEWVRVTVNLPSDCAPRMSSHPTLQVRRKHFWHAGCREGMVRMKKWLSRGIRHLNLIALVSVFGLIIEGNAVAQTAGQHDFQELCASCHGIDGTGTGATLTEANTPNLTLLSVKNGGKFPFAQVYRTIDGRELTASHKRFAMPFWGEYLQHQGQPSAQSEAAVK